uniref:ANF_receptor domain-containing protein n=1 Tax=Heterorhabditis bacteriophora TaxID=37862 RepID=A0A1I7XKM4_HETBA
MDTTTRSFILVLNLKSSMGYDLDMIIVQVETWVKNINKVAPNLIENYILTTYLESKNGFYMKNNVFTTMNDLISYLNGVVISSGLSDQPTLAAINSAQSFTYLMRPMSNVHVFADSPSSDDTSNSLYISSNTTELQLIQRTLSWRNKIIIVLSETKERPLDTFGDEYDVFKRVVRATHGDLLLIRKTEIENVINKLFPYFYQMENIAVRYQTMNMTLESVLIKADSLTQPVNILVNVDQEQILPSITDTNNTLTEVIKGEYFALYRTFMNRTSEINISTISDVNIRIWINSAHTGYLAYSANPEIDVGSAVTISELPSYITGYVTGFTDIKRFSQSTLNLLGYTIEQEISAEIRSSECTFSYQFPPRPTCTPGPFVQTICQILDDTFVYIAPGFVLGGLELTVIGINPTDENSPKILDRI